MSEKKQTIYGIVDDFGALWELMEECGGDVSDPQVEEAYNQFVAELNANLGQKADSYAYIISDALAKSEASLAESKRLASLSKSYENKANKLKELLKSAMEHLNKRQFETAQHKFGICKNGGVQSLDIQVEASQLPKEYQIQPPTPAVTANKDLLTKALLEGKEINGVTFMERGTHLRIR